MIHTNYRPFKLLHISMKYKITRLKAPSRLLLPSEHWFVCFTNNQNIGAALFLVSFVLLFLPLALLLFPYFLPSFPWFFPTILKTLPAWSLILFPGGIPCLLLHILRYLVLAKLGGGRNGRTNRHRYNIRSTWNPIIIHTNYRPFKLLHISMKYKIINMESNYYPH